MARVSRAIGRVDLVFVVAANAVVNANTPAALTIAADQFVER